MKTYLTIFFMGAAYALIYALPFVQNMFYDPLAEALGATNAQLGFLIAIFGIGNIVGAPVGGWIADKFNHKIIYLGALIGNAILCFLFAFNLNYKFAVVIWIGLAVAALFAFYPAHVKIVRLLGDDDNQGQIFGLSEAAGGIGSIIINGVALWLFARAATEIGGFKLAVIGYGVASIIIGVILYFLLDDAEKEEVPEGEMKSGLKVSDFVEVLKYPGTWFTGIAIFTIYTLYVSLYYFTPYVTDILGLSTVIAGQVAIIRTYVIRIFGAPLGGYVGDRMNSASKAVILAALGAIAVILTIMNVPATTSSLVLVILSLLVSAFTYIGRANMFAVQTEVKIPEKFAATAAGITCAIGFSPDLFQFTLFGNWLDKFGDKGYDYIFIYTIAIMIVGIVNGIFSIKYRKKLERA